MDAPGQPDDYLAAGLIARHSATVAQAPAAVHQQAQFTTAGVARDEFGEHARWPPGARQLGIECGKSAGESGLGDSAEFMGAPDGIRQHGNS